MLKRIATTILALVVIGSGASVGYSIVTHEAAPAACATEDSTSCYWDATTRGNGEGRSFTVDAAGNVTFTD